MARFSRILVTDNNNKSASKAAVAAAAPPPQPVALESDFVIILAVLLCALICAVGLIAAARCACRRRRGNNHRSGSGNNRYPSPPYSVNKGLKKKVLQSLPKFTYTTSREGNNSGGGCGNSVKLAPLSSECAICLGEFVEGDELRVLPQCGHGFHVACIDKWLGSHSSCPSCRQMLAVGRCQKCGQFPAVSLPSAGIAGAGGGNEAELNGSESRASTAHNGAAFLP